MKTRKQPESSIVKPLKISAIAGKGTGDGKLIPAVIFDSSSRKDLIELIRSHEITNTPGDTISTWGKRIFNNSKVYLELQFIKPVEVTAVIEFDLLKHASEVDMIMRTNALYIAPLHNILQGTNITNLKKILIEIPPSKPPFDWERVYKKTVIKKFKKEGFNSSQAKENASRFIFEMRNATSFRF